MKILVTGGIGFMGSAFVRLIHNKHNVVIVDNLDYASDINRVNGCKFTFYKADIRRKIDIANVFHVERPEIVVNIAAQTHVDRSIECSHEFLTTNILGTQVLLDLCRIYKVKRYVHYSTDEVYGEKLDGLSSEKDALNPSNPYAASKSSADLLIKSYIRTYNIPAIIVRPTNNYGIYQYPEKFIPKAINMAINHEAMVLYDTGNDVREWIWSEDCALAVEIVMLKGSVGDIYNIGSGERIKNVDILGNISVILGKPVNIIRGHRPGMDFRYALDSSKIRKLGWKPKVKIKEGIKNIIDNLT